MEANITNKTKDLLLEELFRPKREQDIILPERVFKMITTSTQHLMLYGKFGTGKTTIAKIMARRNGIEPLLVNASNDSKVDFYRTQIKQFAEMGNYKNHHKYIILDEADHLSTKSQMLLRGTIEEYAHNVRFIITCNYPEKLIPEFKDRFLKISFDFVGEELKEQKRGYIKRIKSIIKYKKMTIEKPALRTLFNKNYPSMRAIIKIIQACSDMGLEVIKESDIAQVTVEENLTELFKFIVENHKPEEAYTKIMSEFKGNEDVAIIYTIKEFHHYIYKNHPDLHFKLGDINDIAQRFMIYREKSIDPLVTLLSLINQLTIKCR